MVTDSTDHLNGHWLACSSRINAQLVFALNGRFLHQYLPFLLPFDHYIRHTNAEYQFLFSIRKPQKRASGGNMVHREVAWVDCARQNDWLIAAQRFSPSLLLS